MWLFSFLENIRVLSRRVVLTYLLIPTSLATEEICLFVFSIREVGQILKSDISTKNITSYFLTFLLYLSSQNAADDKSVTFRASHRRLLI